MLKAPNLIPKSRFWIVSFLFILLHVILISRFYYLQISQHENFTNKAENNRVRAVTLPAPRGLILDRNGEIIVDNYPTYILYGIGSEMLDFDKNIRIISYSTGIDSNILTRNYKNYYRGRFIPTKLAKDLTIEQLSRLEEVKNQLQGVVYEQFPERVFSSKVRASHVLGYLKEVDRKVLERFTDNPDIHYGDLVGWSGLEKQYEDILRGEKGISYFQVDAFGREVGNIAQEKRRIPHPGKDLHTTLDIKLQQLMEDAFRGKRGAGIVSNPLTGGILAYVSAPDYSPDLFTGFIKKQDWETIIGDMGRPLLNRVSNGLYPPASIYKMIVVAYILENSLFDPSWETTCTGSYEIGDRVFKCWQEFGHGQVNLEIALVQSCDVYFYRTIQRIGIDQLAEFTRSFGFGKITNIDLPTEMKGRVPTRKFMNNLYGRRGWAKGNLLNLAIGQGEILVTPLQIVQYINILATRGNTPMLHLNSRLFPDKVGAPRLSSITWSLLTNYMRKVITDVRGTGRLADPRIDGLVIAGKTGTAENSHGEPHAWFIAYGTKNNETISIVILIENGGHGGEVAAPIARNIFKQYFGKSSDYRVEN